MNIWKELKKPVFILAPMEDVTDTVFRRIVASCGKPDIFFTEFTNVEGLASAGDEIVSQRLLFTQEEKPIIAQIWGKDPEHYYEAAKRIASLDFDGIDINMGCPQKPIIKNGCCSALINNRPLAAEIIAATKEGAGKLPVSVKTRIGFTTIVTEDWISFLLKQNIAALTVHGRTAKELSLVPAHWDEIKKAVLIRNSMRKETLIIGNGDVRNKSDALQRVVETGVEGIMIGRGIFHDPYLFAGSNIWHDKNKKERLTLLKQHVLLFDQQWGNKKPFPILKKYAKIYISGFDGASDLREKLMLTSTVQEMLVRIEELYSSGDGNIST